MDISRTTTPMSHQQKSWLWLWLSLALLAGVMVREVYWYVVYDTREPVAFKRSEVLNSPIRAGEDVVLRVWRDKFREDCPIISHPFAIDVNGVAWGLPSTFTMGGPVGTPFADIPYSTPLDLPPGEYVLRDRLSYRCPDITFEMVQPMARFVVIL